MDELKTLFGNAYIKSSDEAADPQMYYWFQAESGSSFGIRKSGITDKEFQLLKLHYSTLEQPLPSLTPLQQAWTDILYEGKKKTTLNLDDQLTQFVFINFKSPLSDLEAFEEAVLGLFPGQVIVLWPRPQLAILIVTANPNHLPKGEELLELLTADFYVSAKIYFGSPFHNIEMAHDLFQHEKAAFEHIQIAYPNKKAIYFSEVLPLLLLINEPKNHLTLTFGSLSEYLNEEPDSRMYLEALFENNLNLSTTAKALYMHRNSLHYRLEKLKEKTGLDPREFKDALFISLEILYSKLSQ